MAHFFIAVADYYQDITDALQQGAITFLESEGHSHEVLSVPGAFELPATIQMAVDSNVHFDGYIALGCVIRGETTHYDYVCQQCARGLQDIALTQNLAVGFGLVTTENRAQAEVRADIAQKNKGREAAAAAARMVAIKERFSL